VPLDIIKVIYSQTNAQVIVLKIYILKFTLKQLRHVSLQSHHLQGAKVSTDNELPEDGVTAPKHIGAVLM
jgi:hypothetical protein